MREKNYVRNKSVVKICSLKLFKDEGSENEGKFIDFSSRLRIFMNELLSGILRGKEKLWRETFVNRCEIQI